MGVFGSGMVEWEGSWASREDNRIQSRSAELYEPKVESLGCDPGL